MADEEARFGRWWGFAAVIPTSGQTSGKLKMTGALERKVDENRVTSMLFKTRSRFSNFLAVSVFLHIAILNVPLWKPKKVLPLMLTISKLGATLFDISLTKQLYLKCIWRSSRVEKVCFFPSNGGFFCFYGWILSKRSIGSKNTFQLANGSLPRKSPVRSATDVREVQVSERPAGADDDTAVFFSPCWVGSSWFLDFGRLVSHKII